MGLQAGKRKIRFIDYWLFYFFSLIFANADHDTGRVETFLS